MNRVFVRRGEVLAAGVPRRALAKAVKMGAVKRVVLPGYTLGCYRWAEVCRVFALTEQR